MANYRKARVAAFQILYSDELNPGQENIPERIAEIVHGNAEQEKFAADLLEGVQDYRDAIDSLLRSAVKNWQTDRLAAIDRNILRVGIYELAYTEMPPAIVINEAIEIAKEYGAKNSGGFVNGVLDSVRKNVEARQLAEQGNVNYFE